MQCRYFIIEPKFSDPDTFCHFIVGSDRVRASINLYADMCMLSGVAKALKLSLLRKEAPFNIFIDENDDCVSNFYLTVLPHEGQAKQLRFRVFHDWLNDGAPFRADIRFELTLEEANEFARELLAWCEKPEYVFNWKGD